MLHRIVFVAVLGIGIVPAVWGQQAKDSAVNAGQQRLEEWDPGIDQKTLEAQAAARAVLEKPVAEVRFDDTPLSDAVDRLRDLTRANIFVNWKSLAAVGIHRNSPVSMHLRERKFSTVLNLMLELIAIERGKPGYTIDDGVITISTQDDLAKNVVMRVYDIRDLIVPQLDRQVQVDRITRLIEHQVDRRSWKTAGGSVGALRELEGQLIVTQTPDNHRRIVGILKDLRGR